MSGTRWTPDDDESVQPALLARIRKAVPLAGEVIDVPVLRPEQERVAKFVGKCIGIAVIYAIAGLIWAARGVAWAVKFMASRRAPKEA